VSPPTIIDRGCFNLVRLRIGQDPTQHLWHPIVPALVRVRLGAEAGLGLKLGLGGGIRAS
jgi:hypothetical protein